MAISKDYYTLDEAAETLKWTVDDLIYLGGHEGLPIYILADNWCVDVRIREVPETFTENPDIEISDWSPSDATFRDTLTGPVRLYAAVLRNYEANRETTTGRFLGPSKDSDQPGAVYEYQLRASVGNGQPASIVLASRSMVIMAPDFHALLKQEHINYDRPLGTKEQKTLLKLVVGMAMSKYAYDPKRAKSDAVPTIRQDLETLGITLDDGAILKWLRAGAQLVEPN